MHVCVRVVWQAGDFIIDRVELSTLMVESLDVKREGCTTCLDHLWVLLVHEVKPVIAALRLLL